MNLPRLGVNIDHVATLRNARGENYPSPVKAAKLCEEFGADGITAHLREDRRHIKDKDINDMVVAGMDPADIKLIIDSNTYSGLKAKLAMSVWSK